MMIRRTKGFYCQAAGCRQSFKPFTSTNALKQHQSFCPAYQLFLVKSHEARMHHIQTRQERVEEERREAQRLKASEIEVVPEISEHDSVGLLQDEPVLHSVAPPAPEGRGHRKKRPTSKVTDMLPEGPTVLRGQKRAHPIEEDDVSGGPELSDVPQTQPEESTQAQPTLIQRAFRTAANAFGLLRAYAQKPAYIPDAVHVVIPTVSEEDTMTIEQIFAPFPNLSAFRFQHVASMFSANSDTYQTMMANVIGSPDFVHTDIAGINWAALREKVSLSSRPWEDVRRGWRSGNVKIGVPNLRKQRTNHAPEHDEEPDSEGERYTVEDKLWYRPILPLLKSILTSDESKEFHYEPFEQWWSRPGTTDTPVRVYDELYTADAWLEEHRKVQEIVLPSEEDDSYPRAVAAIMLWSDSTHLADFGQQSLWPIYLALGNQSKYDRAKPGAHAMHHLAYLPSLRQKIAEFIAAVTGSKTINSAILSHCRRELFHEAWKLLLQDEEFLKAYVNGIVIKCSDGITRRIFPRIFTYSADYPEKILIATVRDMGLCPCPRCLVLKTDIPKLGTITDLRNRVRRARHDDIHYRHKINSARDFIYNRRFKVNSKAVQNVLKAESLVPTRNAFSAALSPHGFDFFRMLRVDFLHEVELGLFKMVFTHLIRILYAQGDDRVRELNSRYSRVPSFGSSGSAIRKFPDNVSEMKKLAVRDFEDLVQCAIPCFEGLFLATDNESISRLLYVMLLWHGLAKLRMHTTYTLDMLRAQIIRLGQELRHFQTEICPHYKTFETPKEIASRVRLQARRQQRAAAKGTEGQSVTTGQVEIEPAPATGSSGGKKEKSFNLSTSKIHALGDYPPEIVSFGTTDSFSTQLGEHEHRRSKARYGLTSKRNPEPQLVQRDIYDCEMRSKGRMLRKKGVKLPYGPSEPTPTSSASNRFNRDDMLQMKYFIAADEKQRDEISVWMYANRDKVAYQNFIPRLKNYCLARLLNVDLSEEDLDFTDEQTSQIIIEKDFIYNHATVQFNYTTYDVRRERDVIKPGSAVMLPSKEESSPEDIDPHPFWYARVHGIHHVRVTHLPTKTTGKRIDFLWVRWLGQDPEWKGGDLACQLDRVGYVPFGNEYGGPAFGFVDPATVIRGCHLIPAFSEGRTTTLLPPSKFRDDDGDYVNFYVNRFVTRDTLMRYIGFGVGHIDKTTRADPRWSANDAPLDIAHELELASNELDADEFLPDLQTEVLDDEQGVEDADDYNSDDEDNDEPEFDPDYVDDDPLAEF